MRVLLALIAVLTVAACDDDVDRRDAHVDDEDAGSDGGDTDSSMRDATVGPPDGDACDHAADCDDGVFCNGAERCDKHVCVAAYAAPCSDVHRCLEDEKQCDCSIPNHDGEDCDPETFQNDETMDGDGDDDGYFSVLCSNRRLEGGPPKGGDDCDDKDPDVRPGADEVCDYKDNDCDGKVDEGHQPIEFYPDGDGDGYGNRDAEPVMRCENFGPPGYVSGHLQHDCADDDPNRSIDAIELCDGLDNDCDDATDDEDNDEQPLIKPVLAGTEISCGVPPSGGEARLWISDCPGEKGDPNERLWCSDIVDYGCTVDGTTIYNCRECGNTCSFACGRRDCDEIVAVATGVDHSCAKTTEGNIACWGRGSRGQLGNDRTNARDTATSSIGLLGAEMVVAGGHSTCAVRGENRELYCWGDNTSIQLGNFEAGEFAVVPFTVSGAYFGEPTLSQVKSVSIGLEHACASLTTGELMCWGLESYGRIANGNSGDIERGIPLLAYDDEENDVLNASLVAVGERHGCMITMDETVSCWGDNSEGQLGDPTFVEPISTLVRAVPGITHAKAISAGDFHTCVVSDGDVLCWGSNGRLQLGHPDDESNGTPSVVPGLNNVTAIAAGAVTTCAIDEDKGLWCWGGNALGARGDESSDDRAAPALLSIDDVTTVAVGPDHACASTEEGSAFCWGFNFYGQLGDARQSDVEPFEPHRVAPRGE
jgi:alpha-tubulin suppressor-like RCC1 family protein